MIREVIESESEEFNITNNFKIYIKKISNKSKKKLN